MKTIKQLLRQPIKTLFGVVLMTLAVAILCTTVGQAAAASKLQKQMNYQFVSVALPTAKYQMEERVFQYIDGTPFTGEILSKTVFQEVDDFITSLAVNNPDLVKCISSPGLASAYIPQLTPDNRVKYIDDTEANPGGIGELGSLAPSPVDGPNASAMLEIVLDEIADPVESIGNVRQPDGSEMNERMFVYGFMRGTVVRAIGLQEGYKDPAGYTIHLRIMLADMESWENMDLVPGERYLVYGSNYYDSDWKVRSIISAKINDKVLLDELDPDGFMIFPSNKEPGKYKGQFEDCTYELVGIYTGENGLTYDVHDHELAQMRAISMFLEDKSCWPTYYYAKHENDIGGAYVMEWDRCLVREDGEKIPISQEEYARRYVMPTITRLTGSAEDFLESAEGALWKETLEEIRVKHKTFAMIGVDKLGYIGGFAREDARVVSGRDFSEEELETGAKVCILSEHLAALNGLEVGDTISPRFYNYDQSSPYQFFPHGGTGAVSPVPVAYGRTCTWAGEPEDYTIIGLYRPRVLWENTYLNMYTFTPNTIFVPKNSVTSDMDYGNQAFFQTLVLENGAIPAFQGLVAQGGYDGLFIYSDHGYSLIEGSLHDYGKVATQAMEIGCVIYGVILLLFLLLFPGQQRKNVTIMDSLGADRKQKIRHVMGSSLGVLVPGTLLGVGTGALLWQTVTEKLSSEIMKLAIPVPTLILVAAAQLAEAALLVYLEALPMSRSVGLDKRK